MGSSSSERATGTRGRSTPCCSSSVVVLGLFLLALVTLALGFEMPRVMGLPSVLAKLALHPDIPAVAIAHRHLGAVEVVKLRAIPFFFVAADRMSRCRMAQQLADL